MDISAGGLNVLRNIFSQLTVIDVDGNGEARPCEIWEASPDAKIWTFTMEPNAKFHDGKPVTADDVIWTFEKVKNDPRSPMRAYMSVFESMEKVGTDKVKIVLTKPFSAFDRHVSLLPVVGKESYEALGPEKFASQPIGSGPFKVVRWIKDDRIELESGAQLLGWRAQGQNGDLSPGRQRSGALRRASGRRRGRSRGPSTGRRGTAEGPRRRQSGNR